MNPVETLIDSFQELVAQMPELIQPIIVAAAGAIPIIEGDIAAVIGVVGGLHPVVTGIAAATGNFLAVLLVVSLTSQARAAMINRREVRVRATAGSARVAESASGSYLASGSYSATGEEKTASDKPESNGRKRFDRWLVRYGVPGASILGPLAIPTQLISAVLVGGGTSKGWVLLWQAVTIAIWTTIATISSWLALQVVVQL